MCVPACNCNKIQRKTKSVRIAIDVMGGDHAPDVILAGSLDAIELLDETDQMVLVGDEQIIRAAVSARGFEGDARVEIEATTEIIAMNESPVQALRSKANSSIVKMAQLGSKKAGERKCDAIISAGNTGACVAAAQMYMRRLPGVHRPGIAVTIPSFYGPVVVCDVGANPGPRASHLHQYAHMAGIYAERLIGIENPKVALLSIGSEEGKGNALTKETAKLIREDSRINYVGYCEGRELFDGKANVVLTEGFTGNVVLKLAEGLSMGLIKTIKHEIVEVDPSLAERFKPVLGSLMRKHDYHEYGGAPLMGANGICLICHGSSEARTIVSAVKAARKFVQLNINETIVETLADSALEGAV
jgi:phosphate acyltransferase